MTGITFQTLNICSENLSKLSGILDFAPEDVRAVQFRIAERSLTVLNHKLDLELKFRAKEWLSLADSLGVLRAKLQDAENLQSQRSALEKQLADLEDVLKEWRGLSPEARRTWQEFDAWIREYLPKRDPILEGKAQSRFALYKQLESLVPYSEEVDHLCQAIKHYAKRDEYEQERTSLEERILTTEIRLKTVKRGFFLSLLLCVFVVTLPLCVPFAFSLWNRTREIEKQLSDASEARRRVLRRLDLAAEGVVAAEDITAVVDERSLGDIRNILLEVRDLHREFGAKSRNNDERNLLARILSRFHKLGVEAEKLFEATAEDFRENLARISRGVERMSRNCETLQGVAEQVLQLHQEHSQTLRGYDEDVIRQTILRLSCRQDELFDLPLSQETTVQLLLAVQSMPDLLARVQLAVSELSYGRMPDLKVWQRLAIEVKAASTTVNAVGVEWEMGPEWDAFEGDAPDGEIGAQVC